MHKLLIPLLAAFALPTAVNAESYWLLIMKSGFHGVGLEKIEMKSIDDCEKQGDLFINSMKEESDSAAKYLYFVCVTGK